MQTNQLPCKMIMMFCFFVFGRGLFKAFVLNFSMFFFIDCFDEASQKTLALVGRALFQIHFAWTG